MRMLAIALLATVLATFAATAAAETGAGEGFGMLAMASDGGQDNLDSGPASTTIDTPDFGGGAVSARGGDGALPVRAGGSERATATDATAAQADAALEPSTPAAQTPKRPSYRWQSLVPGAIK